MNVKMKNSKNEIIKNLKSLSGKKNISEIFFDWIHLMSYTISNSVDRVQYDKREEAYLQTIKPYTKEEGFVFADCFALLVNALEYKQIDWLGEIYMDLEISSADNGQFFTPYHISQLMADLSFSEKEELLNERDWIGYYEPACGAGSLIIAFAQSMEKRGYNYQQQLVAWCEDIDENCLLMTYIQLSLLGIKAVCQVKNSLTQEEYSTWYTPFYLCFPPTMEQKEATVEKIVETVAQQQETQEIEQLALF